jgi:predicted PurR-regulated permease PerM
MKEIFLRVNQYLAFVILLVIILHFGKIILVPIGFAALFAMLMAPVCNYLEKKGLNRSFSSLACVLIILGFLIAMIAVVGGQFAAFKKDVPKIREKATEFVASTQEYVQEKFGIEPEKQKQIARDQASKGSEKGGGMVRNFIGGLTTTIGTLVLMLVYTFLMIYNKEQFENFFLKLYKDQDETRVQKVVDKIATVSQKYLTGRLMSISIIFCLYAVGLTLVGIKNAILLAAVAAIMTVVPFVGTVLGGLIPVFTALATEDSIQPALYAGGVLFFIQTMDNYFIEPNIVGGEVNLSALTSIFSVIVGGLLWGVAGMILFLPFAGILKIICDNVEPLKPIGYLLGEPGGQKPPSKIKTWIRENIFRVKVKK